MRIARTVSLCALAASATLLLDGATCNSLKSLKITDAADVVRLFMVPGMEHCGGAATDYFGQNSVPRNDADHDIDAAVERWVEQGKAPEQIIAAKLKERANSAAGVSRTRPLCAWPKTAHYKGSGRTDNAANFECR